MISAKEARHKAMMCIGEKDQQLLNKIESSVGRTIADGKCECWVNGCASGRVIAELQKLGYKVRQHYDQRDGDCIQIEW